jgi:hypothetical protein
VVPLADEASKAVYSTAGYSGGTGALLSGGTGALLKDR